MAKAKNLAGLAALGALGYMLARGKGDKGDTTQSGTPDLPVSPDEEPRRQISDYMKKAPQDPREAAAEAPSAASEVFASKPKTATAPRTSTTAKTGVKTATKPTPKGRGRLDVGGSSPALAAMEARKAARDEDARIGNINAYNRDIKGQNMENQILKNMQDAPPPGLMRKGGAVKKMASGGMTASKRADGIASRGKTKCKMY